MVHRALDLADSCEHGNEPSVKTGNFLMSSDHQLLKKDYSMELVHYLYIIYYNSFNPSSY
jgi:hypothetical protein